MPSSLKHIGSKALFVLCLCLAFIVNDRRCYGSRIRRFTWEVGYVFWSPDCQEHVVMGINGQFPGPTIRAKVGDTIVVNLTNTLHTEGVVIHWHGIRQWENAFPCGDSLQNPYKNLRGDLQWGMKWETNFLRHEDSSSSQGLGRDGDGDGIMMKVNPHMVTGTEIGR
ncbi:hypothetical protein Syun_003651 [Stephania yunnanensis]|uniref:Plastocyanin-like domain-containing protein n=1 Tax=Stephania yunnanensis TaxID=152371 RepID=A0AAP0L5H4_9MAGN